LNDKRAKKQEDIYPILLFDSKNVRTAIKQGKPGIAYALLPWTLLKNAILDQRLSRETRIDYLQHAYALIFLYYLALKRYNHKKKSCPLTKKILEYPQCMNRFQTKNTPKEKQRPITLLDKGTCKKALSLIVNILTQLSKETSMHLGAFGSHFLEHFFGLIRTLDHGDDRYSNFLRSCIQSVLINELKQDYGIQIKIPSRNSDSGATVLADDPVIAQPFGAYISFAINFITAFANFDAFLPADIAILRDCISNFPPRCLISELINQLTPEESPLKNAISTRSMGLNRTGGLANDRRNESKSSLMLIPKRAEECSIQPEIDEILLFRSIAILYFFVKSEQNWVQKGCGPIGIIENETNRSFRNLMRNSGTLSVCSSHQISSWMTAKFDGTASICWVSVEMIGERPESKILRAKFCDSETAWQFQEAFMTCASRKNQ
jgi:hypothetical protein